jgi:hypothetical protein
MLGGVVDRLSPYFSRQPRVATAAPPPNVSVAQPAVNVPQPAVNAAPPAQRVPAAAPLQPPPPADLARRREELARRFAELQWDLGGLAYEMAVRDRIRPDLLARRSAELRGIDAQIATIDRLLRTPNGVPAGACPACGAAFQAGAGYCWQCGKNLRPQPPAAVAPPPTQPAPLATPRPATPPPQPRP